MKIGELRHRVELQSPTNVQNDFGEQTQTFTTFATVWGQIEPLTGRELEFAQQISEEINNRITIRYNATLTSKHRILFGSRIFEVVSPINPEERNEFLQVFCKEIK